MVADALPVGMTHEAVQGRESTDAQHQQITFFPGADGDLRQAAGACPLSLKCRTGQEQRFEWTPSVGLYQLRHRGL